MAGSNTPRLPGSALGLPDLVNRGQITGGNAANNSDYPSPYHSGTSAPALSPRTTSTSSTTAPSPRGDGSGANGVAVRLTGDGNRLELANGSSIMGHILSTGRNTLALNSADGKPTTASMTGDLYLGPGDTFEVRATPPPPTASMSTARRKYTARSAWSPARARMRKARATPS